MAFIEVDGEELWISEEDYLNSCTKKEIRKLKELLVGGRLTVTEKIFENHLDAIHGNFNNLTDEEEEQIMKIGKKFI
jgi:hypothetical protein